MTSQAIHKYLNLELQMGPIQYLKVTTQDRTSSKEIVRLTSDKCSAFLILPLYSCLPDHCPIASSTIHNSYSGTPLNCSYKLLFSHTPRCQYKNKFRIFDSLSSNSRIPFSTPAFILSIMANESTTTWSYPRLKGLVLSPQLGS